MTARFLPWLVLAGALLAPAVLSATPDGQFGRTSRTTGGCGTSQCHGGSANGNTTVAFAGFTDSLTVTPGSTTSFTVIVSHATAFEAGVNIGAKTTENGGQNAGTLQTVNGGHLQLLGAELAHFDPVRFESGSVSFMFKWIAPTAPGVYFLRAVANAVNGDRTTLNDQWNFAPVLRLRVTPADGVQEVLNNNPLATLGISPVPAHDYMTLTTASNPGSVYSVNVLDLTGTLVFADMVTSTDNMLEYVWTGTTSAGIQAPQGSYVVAVSGDGSVRRGRAVIVR